MGLRPSVICLVMFLLAVSCCGVRRCSLVDVPNEAVGLDAADLSDTWVIGDPFANPAFGLSVYTKHDCALVRFEVSTGGDGKGHALWRPLDQVWVPIEPESTWIAGDLLCPCYVGTGSVCDPEIFALVRGRAVGEKWPLRAWKANRKTGQITEISPGGVRCVLHRSLSE
jgi:hypothetical protein